jgi:hypothetical protein
MQEQRLFLSEAPVICIESWQAPGFAASLATRLRGALDAARAGGQDMVLSLALHHDDETGGLATVVGDALATVLTPERDKSTPRAAGAFIFDSYSRTVRRNDLRPLVLWCPAVPGADLDLIPAASERDCPLIPDFPDIVLGPFTFNSLPILPSRAQYLTFIGKYSEGQAGQMKAVEFSAPQRTPLSVNVPLGEFGTATFFNNEIFTPAAQDALSYCAPAAFDDPRLQVVFRTGAFPSPLPLQNLPEVHRLAPQPSYGIGLSWDSPFLLRLSYEVVFAGQVTVFTLSAPFGIRSVSEKYLAGQVWLQGEFDLRDALQQCTRFCDFPTFDTGGVYNVGQPFRTTYESRCYGERDEAGVLHGPVFPKLGDGGFPRDP